MAEIFTNLARSTLAAPLTAVGTTLTVATGDGNLLFPAAGAGDFFRAVLFNKTTGNVEIVTCTNRSGDNMTISRAQEEIGNITPAVAYAFSAGDLIELRPTSAFFGSLGAVSSTAIQSMSFNFGADGGAANAYSVTISPAYSSYASPMPIAFLANASNTGACTLEDATLGSPKSIKRLDGSDPRAGDIVVNEVAYCMYDTTAATFKLLNPRSAGWPSNFKFDNALEIAKLAYFTALFDNGTVTATSKLIDWDEGNKQKIILSPATGNNIDLTFNDPPGPTDLKLTVYQDGTGSRTLSFPSGTKFTGGSAPVLSTTPNAEDILVIYYDAESGAGAYHVGLAKGWSA